jgi:hypothetical protein
LKSEVPSMVWIFSEMNSDLPLTRVDLAIEQLDVALELFLKDRSVASALTLAGAAEEILGRALKLKGHGSVIEVWYDAVDDRWGVKWKEYINTMNAARNGLKHLNSEKDFEVSFDPFWEAVFMLLRACSNYERLGHQKTDRMWEFEEWYHSKFLESLRDNAEG